MLKTIWMSDPHFTAEGDVLGYDPRVRVQAAVAHVNALHGDARYCVISGDMVNRGSREDYEALGTRLDALSMPVLPLVGNHDAREMFRQCLPLPDTCMDGFVQYVVPTDEGLIVCLDTQKAGSDAGEFCGDRSEWLTRVLHDARDTPVFLFMHHPPMRLGLPMQDTDNLEGGDAFVSLISSFPNVQYLFIGHVHRPISGRVRGIPFSTMRSVLYQAPAPRPDWTWETFHPSEEAPNLGVITIADGSVILQYEQFCGVEVGRCGAVSQSG